MIIENAALVLGAALSLLTSAAHPSTPSAAPVVIPAPVSNIQKQQNLAKYLTVEAALLGVSDNISLYFKDLTEENEFSIEPTKSWIPASTIKAYVVLEAFRQRDLGLINFDNQVTVTADNVVPTELETDEFPRLREGTKVTIRQLVEAMITQSDNTAYNTLLDILDRRNINLALKNIGLTETVVGEKLNLDDSQFQTDLQVAGRQPNTTTVKDLATFFDLLYNKKIADSDEILSIFKRQKINNMIPALLPDSTEVAHKTGDWAPIYHDGGVVFKPNEPFVLTVFTNAGDPSVVAKLARVAYFQTPDSVGKSLTLNSQQPDASQLSSSPYSQIALSQLPDTNVLGASQVNAKFPTITAADLGIDQSDLSISPTEASNLNQSIIRPGSILDGLVGFIRSRQLATASNNSAKVQTYLDTSKDKLTQAKSLLASGDTAGIQPLLDQSEQNLAKATDLAKNDPNKDLLLVQIKQVNDLHFAVLNQSSGQLSSDQQKQQFIDSVYNFYQKNQKEVTTVVNTSVIANVEQQKPAIGTVTAVKDNTATVQFDDGVKKDVILNDATKVRSFGQDNYQTTSSIGTGDKIAVVGITNNDAKIVPEFILKDVPKELPSEHTGTIIEIKPDQNTLKILDKQGNEETINIDVKTLLQSKDTDVSLSGIKAGSEITVFGVPLGVTSSTPSASLTPEPTSSDLIGASGSTPSPSASILASTSPFPSVSSSPTPLASPFGSIIPKVSPTPTPVKSGPAVVIKATTITVTTNGSGKNEVVTPVPTKVPTPAPAKVSAPAPAPKPAAPAPKLVPPAPTPAKK